MNVNTNFIKSLCIFSLLKRVTAKFATNAAETIAVIKTINVIIGLSNLFITQTSHCY